MGSASEVIREYSPAFFNPSSGIAKCIGIKLHQGRVALTHHFNVSCGLNEPDDR
jgi:hypothetical protein